MIVRMWHGRVPSEKARRYREFLNSRAIPDYRSVPGNISVHVLERVDGAVTHFVTMTFWESMAAIRGFAGEDVEVAKYYPEDQDFLLEFEPKVIHYEVVGSREALRIGWEVPHNSEVKLTAPRGAGRARMGAEQPQGTCMLELPHHMLRCVFDRQDQENAMAKNKDDARAEGFKRGLAGKVDTAGMTQGWTDDKAAGTARTQGYVDGKRKRSRNEAEKRERDKK
jgi:heme-degrading monooxygenase HmoA